MEWGYGCIHVRDEIMVKAWCAWCVCVCDAPLTVGYCELLYTTRRWLGGLVDHLGSWTDFTFQDWQAGRNDNEWLPCYRGGDGADRACAVSRSAGAPKPPHQPTCPPDDGSQRGVHLGPGSPGCTCQGIKAPCDGLSVCPPVLLPVLAVQPVTPCCRDPREETGPRESGVRPGRRDAVRETDRQTVDEISVRKGPERRGDMRHSKVHTVPTYLGSPHVRHLHLTSAKAWKDQFENLQFSQLSPGFLFPGPPTDYYYPVVWPYADCCFAGSLTIQSIHLPIHYLHPQPSSVIQSVSQSVSERAGQSSNSSPSTNNQVHSSTLREICIKVPRLISPSCPPAQPSCAIPARPVSSHLLCTGLLLFTVIPYAQPFPRLARA